MSSPVSRTSKAERLQASRAQFLAALGTRLAALRQALGELEANADSDAARRGLRRRLQAMADAAGVLSFAEMSESFAAAAARLEGDEQPGTEVFAALRQTLALIPGLVPERPEPAADDAADASLLGLRLGPCTVLALGSPNQRVLLESALREYPQVRVRFASELQDAERQADVYQPDVVVIDARRADADEAVRRFDAHPCLVVEAEPAAVDPLLRAGVHHVTIRGEDYPSAVLEGLSRLQRRATAAAPRHLESATLEQITEWVSDEIRAGLLGPIDGDSRQRQVPLDQGRARAVLWSMIARLREMIADASGGAIGYENDAPEGALLLTGRQVLSPADERRQGDRRPELTCSSPLRGRTVLIAEDEPATAWFLANLIRAAGAEVLEARDGMEAWKLARERTPELVISDVMMPALDGFSLCRNLKRDIVLGDVPVILLSWKEDLLQRVRELGVGADAYMPKETEASAIVARCAAALEPRARVERRMREETVVYGRLDGITTYTVLRLVSRIIDNATVAFEDAAFHYQVQLGDGRILRARRTARGADDAHGGEAILPGLLGMRAGRFTVERTVEAVQAEWYGGLETLLLPHVERVRRAMSHLQGVRLGKIARVELDWAAVEPYLQASPSIVRRVLEALQQHPPLALLSRVSATLLENVLVDAALRGGVAALIDFDDQDVLVSVDAEPEPFDITVAALGPGVDLAPAPGAPRVNRESTPADAQRAAHFARAAAEVGVPPDGAECSPSSAHEAKAPAAPEPAAVAAAPTTPEPTAVAAVPTTPEPAAVAAVPTTPEPAAVAAAALSAPEPAVAGPSRHADSSWTPVDLAEVVASGLATTPAQPVHPSSKNLAALRPPVRVQRAAQSSAQLRAPNRGATLTGLGRPERSSEPRSIWPADDGGAPSPKTTLAATTFGDEEQFTTTPGTGVAAWLAGSEETAGPGSWPPAQVEGDTESKSWPPAQVEGDTRSKSWSSRHREEIAPGSWPAPVEVDDEGGAVAEESTPAIANTARALVTPPAEPQLIRQHQRHFDGSEALPAADAGSRERVSTAPVAAEPASVDEAETNPAPEVRERAARVTRQRRVFALFRGLGKRPELKRLGRFVLPAAVVLGAASGMYALTGWVADQLDLQAAAVDGDRRAAAVTASLKPAPGATGAEARLDIAPPGETKTAPTARTKLHTFELPIPGGIDIGDKGLLEIDSGGRHKIYVDDVFVGRGPVRRVPLPAGEHEVRVRDDAREQSYRVTLTAGRRVRLSEPHSASNERSD